MERNLALLEAENRANAARTALRSALTNTAFRFSPQQLKAEAAIAATQQIDGAKAALRRSARRHPLATWSAVAFIAAILTYALRRPASVLACAGIDTIRTLRQRIIRRKKTQ